MCDPKKELMEKYKQQIKSSKTHKELQDCWRFIRDSDEYFCVLDCDCRCELVIFMNSQRDEVYKMGWKDHED